MIGREILNYVVESVIGVGGMGTVYLARNKFIKEQLVAIKVIKSTFINIEAKHRLKTEASILASLDHPNIVKFYNYDIDGDGNVYLVMEYVEGETIEEYINTKTGLIVESRILPLFEPILNAFEYAHKRNIVHRDIKPSNIIITPDGKPKILDFGISSILKRSSADKQQESVICGTPSYMSPEQVYGKGIDTRSDIYSLGVLLHQMLTGNAPYDTTTLSEVEIQDKVVNEPLPRMKTYYRYVSDKVQAIVDKATAKNPDERYQSCAEFKKALEKALVKKKLSKPFVVLSAIVVLITVIGIGFAIDYNRVKIRYYKDYVEQWGVPQGIGRMSASARKHMSRVYRFEYKNYKLQRVSHVNSLGSLIDDMETERAERPVDMILTYKDDGHVDRIKIKDRSGKVLYVKAYNDKLNSVIFQQNDEYGTEKSLSSSSVSFTNTNIISDQNKGKISRYLLKYDNNGYVESLTFAGFQNVKTSDANGIYGRKYIRDEKGRVTEEHYLGYDGTATSTSWGLGIKKFQYEDDNLVRVDYYTKDGHPAKEFADGTYAYTMEYDEWGNVIESRHITHTGELMLPGMNRVAGATMIYDDNGFLIKQTYLGLDGEPGYEPQNMVSTQRMEYDENGYLAELSFYDTEDNPVPASNGMSRIRFLNDKNGNPVEQWFYGLNDSLVVASEGNAGTKVVYDSIGNPIQFVYYGSDNLPTEMPDGMFGYKAEYNNLGLMTKYIPLGKNLQPIYECELDLFISRIDYDIRGNVIKVSFYDVNDSNLVESSERIAGWNSQYDDLGNEIERTFFNMKGKPCSISYGYSKLINEFNEQSLLIKQRFYNKNELTIVNGVAGYDYKYDDKGRKIEEIPIGVNNKPYTKNLPITKYTYDDDGNILSYSFYNAQYAPVIGDLGFHRASCVFDERRNMLELRLFGKDNKPVTINGDNYSAQIKEYDDKGNCIKMTYQGVDGHFVLCKEGWSSVIYEYNQRGQIVKQRFFGLDGKPTNPETMAPVGIVGYDKWGNNDYVAAQDTNGKFIIHPQYGYSIRRYTFDVKGNIIAEAYYDTLDKPMHGAGGYYKAIYEYSSTGLNTESRFYGKDGLPCLNIYDYHKEINKYDDKNLLLESAWFDTKGNPRDNSFGIQKVKYVYNNNGEVTSRKSYTADGTHIATEQWDGTEWIVTSTQQTVHSDMNEYDVSAEIAYRDQYIEAFNMSCPLYVSEEYGELILEKAEAAGLEAGMYVIRFIFRSPYSKYELSSTQISKYEQCARDMQMYVKAAVLQETGLELFSFKARIFDSKNRIVSEL